MPQAINGMEAYMRHQLIISGNIPTTLLLIKTPILSTFRIMRLESHAYVTGEVLRTAGSSSNHRRLSKSRWWPRGVALDLSRCV